MSSIIKRWGIVIAFDAQAVLGLLFPHAFPYLPWLLGALYILAAIGVLLFTGTVRRHLLTDPVTRMVHGLEHAALELLEKERGIGVRGGWSRKNLFSVTLVGTDSVETQLEEIRGATISALHRVPRGEHTLLYTPQCSTSMIVGSLGLVVTIACAGTFALFAGVPSGIAFAATVAAYHAWRVFHPFLGILAQRWFTVSPFAGGTIKDIKLHKDTDVREYHVTVDVIPVATEGGPVAPGPFA